MALKVTLVSGGRPLHTSRSSFLLGGKGTSGAFQAGEEPYPKTAAPCDAFTHQEKFICT